MREKVNPLATEGEAGGKLQLLATCCSSPGYVDRFLRAFHLNLFAISTFHHTAGSNAGAIYIGSRRAVHCFLVSAARACLLLPPLIPLSAPLFWSPCSFAGLSLIKG